MELNITAVALDKLVSETVKEMEGSLQGKDVVLTAEFPPEPVTLKADESKLKQVIVNLLSNAIKFTRQGSIIVRVLTEAATNKPLALSVTDTGIGIPQDQIAKIFEPFKQADSSSTRKYGGTGLGLSISLSLCNMMGYGITVESEPNKGSTFSVVFDLAKAQELGAAAPQSQRFLRPQ